MAMESENTKRLAEATYKLSNLDPRLKVNVKGKSYAPVKERLRVFREHFGADASFISTVEFKDPIFFKNAVSMIDFITRKSEDFKLALSPIIFSYNDKKTSISSRGLI